MGTPGDTPQRRSGGGGCLKAAGIGCGVLILVAIGLSIWGYSMMMKNPAAQRVYQQSQSMGMCAGNMGVIGKALNQYSADHGGAYPTKLDDLYPKYITDRSKLFCQSGRPVPYEYKQPAPTASDDTVVVTCRQHVVVEGQPPIAVYVMKNGKVETNSSSGQSPSSKPAPTPTPTKP